jgi:aarF domain-containing kinase
MAPTVVSKIIYESFGESPYKLFSEWSARPFATASIGQVHRARLKSGELVAVKIQYPEIQASLKGDLKFVGFIANLARLLSPELKSILTQIGSIILDETDYMKEARSKALNLLCPV